MLAGKEIMGKSSDSVGGGEEVAGVLEAGVPFPPDVQWKRLGRCEELWESSKLGDMPLEEGGVAMPHKEEGLHSGSFPPQEEFSSQAEFWRLEVCGLR